MLKYLFRPAVTLPYSIAFTGQPAIQVMQCVQFPDQTGFSFSIFYYLADNATQDDVWQEVQTLKLLAYPKQTRPIFRARNFVYLFLITYSSSFLSISLTITSLKPLCSNSAFAWLSIFSIFIPCFSHI